MFVLDIMEEDQAALPTHGITVARLKAELETLNPLVSRRLNAPSSWNGEVTLGANAATRGRRLYAGGIEVDVRLAGHEARWRTLIHELVHAHSAGLNPPDYDAYRGWEEAVVENIQRRIRPGVLAEAGVTVDEAVFRAVDDAFIFNDAVSALEELRRVLPPSEQTDDTPNEAAEAEAFYRELLRVPLKQRLRHVFEQGMALPAGARRSAFVRAYSAATARLQNKA